MKNSGLNRDEIKYIAIFAMLLDHIAWYFLDFASPAAQIFHTVGRITAPVMCFFLAQGFKYTRSRPRYALRLGGFALVSQIPWVILRETEWYALDFNMLFTLLICLFVLWAYEDIKNAALKYLVIAALFAASMACDWFFLAPMFTLVFYFAQQDRKKMCLRFAVAAAASFAVIFLMNLNGSDAKNALLSTLYVLGLFLCIPLLLLYNGRKGRYKASKWVFYIFYPAHLAVIAAVLKLTGA